MSSRDIQRPRAQHAAEGQRATCGCQQTQSTLTVLFLDTILSSFFAIRMRSSSRVIAAFAQLFLQIDRIRSDIFCETPKSKEKSLERLGVGLYAPRTPFSREACPAESQLTNPTHDNN